mgnify:CR=1 FL=1
MVERRLERLLVFLRNVGEHPVGKIVVRVRLVAHADLHAGKCVGTQARNDRLDSIVAAGRAVFAHADAPDGKTDIVKDHDDPLGRDFIKVRAGLNAQARRVHIRLGLDENQALSLVVAHADLALEFRLVHVVDRKQR